MIFDIFVIIVSPSKVMLNLTGEAGAGRDVCLSKRYFMKVCVGMYCIYRLEKT